MKVTLLWLTGMVMFRAARLVAPLVAPGIIMWLKRTSLKFAEALEALQDGVVGR